MVIPLSFPRVVNMRIILKVMILPLSIMVLLSRTAYSTDLKPINHIKSATFVSKSFEVGPGAVAAKSFLDIDFPRGHIGVKSFDAELIDDCGNSVPLYETYLHHFFAIRYFENTTMSHNTEKYPNPFDAMTFKRNGGTCEGYILPYYWGLGGETRGTSTNIPNPFALEFGNPSKIPDGLQEKWLFDIMAIDTRGALNRKGCAECRCNLFNLPKDFYNVTKGIDGQPISHNYKGGFLCCQDNLQCKLRNGFLGQKRRLSLRYKIRWVDWDEHQVPVEFYVLDSTSHLRSNGSKQFNDCQVEYTIPRIGNSDTPHVQKANILMENGGYLIYATAHMHSGAVNATLYGQDGKTLCTTTPKYGTGKEAGNEKGYTIGMSVCYPEPGSIKIKDGEILTVESRYENKFLTGAMGQFYIYLAKQLPKEDVEHSM